MGLVSISVSFLYLNQIELSKHIIKTQPLQQWSVAREFRRRLKKALDEQGIEVGIPQQMMYFSDNFAKSKIYRENN